MARLILRNRILVAAGLCLALAFSYTDAFARDRVVISGSHRHEVSRGGHDRDHYRYGRTYAPSWFWFNFVFGNSHAGAVVSFIPSGHRTFSVGGSRYYYYNHTYYRDCPGGYMVVPAPAVVTQQPSYGQTITINVPNSNGTYTAVTLVRRNNGYIGPQGEFYSGNPTIDQLIALYAK